MQGCFFWAFQCQPPLLLLMVQESGEKTTWDGAKTLSKYWDKLPTSTGDRQISAINSNYHPETSQQSSFSRGPPGAMNLSRRQEPRARASTESL